MASLPQARTVTCEEWLAMPQVEDSIEEVVNGEIRIMPPAKLLHALTEDQPEVLCLENGILASGGQLKPKLCPNVLIDNASIWPD